jgi:hypothetical protein
MVKLLIVSAIWHTPQNMVSDTIMHVTLNTLNKVDKRMNHYGHH